jgi:hypothetical protein
MLTDKESGSSGLFVCPGTGSARSAAGACFLFVRVLLVRLPLVCLTLGLLPLVRTGEQMAILLHSCNLLLIFVLTILFTCYKV